MSDQEHQDIREPTAFDKAILKAGRSMSDAQEIAQAIVGNAVRDVLGRVAKEYDLDEDQLIDTYANEVIRKHCATARGDYEDLFCTAITKNKKRCTKRAVCDRLCKWHFEEGKKARVQEQLENYKNQLGEMTRTQAFSQSQPAARYILSQMQENFGH